MVNTGGFSIEEAKAIEKRALELGAATTQSMLTLIETYYRKGIRYLILEISLKTTPIPYQ